MRAIRGSLFPTRGRILAAPSSKRLSGLNCLELRKTIQESARKHLRMKIVWNQFMYEVCRRISQSSESQSDGGVDKFTPTDISLIFLSFASIQRQAPKFFDFLLRNVRSEVTKYELRDIAVLFTSMAKLKVTNSYVLDSFKDTIVTKLTKNVSEKDVALLLNAILELNVPDPSKIFLQSSLILSSRIKYIENCHTLTLLLYSYSRFQFLARSFMDLHQTKNGDTAEENPEYNLVSSTTISLLGKCMALQMDMRPTDLLYLYMACLTLVYKSKGLTQHVICNMVALNKLHNRIKASLFEFPASELLLLAEQCQRVLREVENMPLQDGESPLLSSNNEVLRTVPWLLDSIVGEMTFRLEVLPFDECLGLLNLLEPSDERIDLIFRRLQKKLENAKTWDRYTNAKLLEIIGHINNVNAVHFSTSGQCLLPLVVKQFRGILKLREICAIAEAASKLGVKSNALEKIVKTVKCRVDRLEPYQVASLISSLVALGYINVVHDIAPHAIRINRHLDAVDTLVAFSILKLRNLLKLPDASIEHLRMLIGESPMSEYDDVQKNKLAFIYASKILQGNDGDYDGQYNFKIGTGLHTPSRRLILDKVQLKNKKVIIESRTITKDEQTCKFADEVSDFLMKFDRGSSVSQNAKHGRISLPIKLNIKNKGVAIVPLLDDFYNNPSKMLRLDVCAQLELLDMPYVCSNLSSHMNTSEKGKYIANVVERCYNALESFGKKQVETTTSKTSEVAMGADQEKVSSFTRLRGMFGIHTGI